MGFLSMAARRLPTLASSPDAHHQLPYMQVPELTSLRQQIDAIDEELVELLSGRFRITDRVGQLKAEQGLHAVDPARESQQAQRLHELAARHGVTATLVNHIFRAVVDQVVLNHQSIAAARHPASQ